MASRKNRAAYRFDPETENFLANEAERTGRDVTSVVASLVAKERARRFEAMRTMQDVWAVSPSKPLEAG